MTEAATNVSGLSADRRALLEKLLEKKGIQIGPSLSIEPRPIGEPIPLSYAQRRLWFLDQIGAGTAYNMQMVLQLDGELNVAALHDALDRLVERHHVLRTGFPMVGGIPVQEIAAAGRLALPIVDFSQLGLADLEAEEEEVRRLVREDATRRFDMAAGPLFRAMLMSQHPGRHVLLLTLHHSTSDGWSMSIFSRELVQLYKAYDEGRVLELPELKIQYADFAHWQLDRLESGALEDQFAYWREQLRGMPVLDLPTDRPRPTSPSYRGGLHLQYLSEELTRELDKLSRREGITSFMTFLAGFQTLMGRYTGQDDVAIGSPVANRTRVELQELVGFFVNSLVLRGDLSGDPTVRELLQRVHRTTVDAIGNQDVPFEELVRDLHPERDPGRNPLFQIMFSVENEATGQLDFPGITAEPLISASIDAARFDIEVALERVSQETQCRFLYSTDLFDAETIERMMGHYIALLSEMVAHPNARISELSMLSDAERHDLVVKWNDTSSAYPRDTSVGTLVARRAETNPNAIAVTDPALDPGCRELSYRELDGRANQLARHLAARGVGHEIRVGVFFDRSADFVVAILGILKAGGAYVPLDVDLPRERIDFMIEDARLSMLLSQNQHRAALPDGPVEVICIDSDWEVIAAQSDQPVPEVVAPESIAYVIYTSGSTGKPKGVEVTHRGLVNLVTWYHQRFSVTFADRSTQLASTAFDGSVWEIWPCLTAGASLQLVPCEVRLSPDRLRDWMIAESITISFMPTPLAELVMHLDWPAEVPFRTLLLGGDRLLRAPDTALPFDVINAYGPTETTVIGTVGPVSLQRDLETAPGIGGPIANTQALVLDSSGQLVPIGVPGELHIGGDGLARGYLERPGLTAERFVPNPFAGTGSLPGSRLYRTGDRVRRLADGTFDFLGRIDHQVEIRGFRVELGEIEALLQSNDTVAEAAVIAREDVPGNRRLVAYVVSNVSERPHDMNDESANHSAFDSAALRQFLQERLPAYMVPAAFVPLDALPLNSGGKLDRKALPAPDGNHPESGEALVAPHTPAQELVARIWCDLLELDEVGIHDNFFDLGGHSLLFARVVVALEEEFDRKLDAKELMFRTLAQIAAIGESEEIVETETAPPIELSSEISELAAASDRRAGSRRIEPLFFGAENRSLFGCHHPARGTPRPCAMVLCYPMGEEYVHFHRAYRQLADNLAAVGFPVFRFDFFGCGDSAGDSESSNLDHWLEDISLAIDESKRRNGVEQICLVGFRMGATLAALAGTGRTDVDAVGLLDPIIHGPSYLAELREWHAKMLRLASVRPRRDNGIRGEEILGFAYGKQLIKGIDGLDLESIPQPLFNSALVVESRQHEYTGPFRQRLEAQGSKISHLHIPHPELWKKADRFQLEDVNRVQMPRKMLQAAATWVKKRYA